MQSELELIKEKLSDKRWRIFSGKLYRIKDKYGNNIPFIPNKFQEDFYNRKHKKNIILKARQLGFSTMLDIMKLDDALFSAYKNYGIIAQDLNAANSIFHEKIKFAFDNLPEWLKREFMLKTDRKGEMKFENNTCSIAVDTSFRSSTLQGLHISEYGKICAKYPEKAREIQTGALNTLAPNSEVDIESTAEGNSGYFFDMCMLAMSHEESEKLLTDMDYKFFFYPWYLDETYELEDTFPINSETQEYFTSLLHNEYIQSHFPNVLFTDAKKRWWQKKKEEQKEDMIREYPSFPKEAFDLAIKGAYYEKELSLCRSQKRIGQVPYDNRLKVRTHWDLGGAGGGDETAIWFYQIYGKEVRIIDYWEGSGYSMLEIIDTIVKDKPYEYEKHYFPHDSEVHEYTTGNSRIQVAREHLGNCEVVPRMAISDGINAVREMFPNCFFDEAKCITGITRLGQYQREYDEKNGLFKDKPLHNTASNCADAFRYLATTYKTLIRTPIQQEPKQFYNRMTGQIIKGGIKQTIGMNGKPIQRNQSFLGM